MYFLIFFVEIKVNARGLTDNEGCVHGGKPYVALVHGDTTTSISDPITALLFKAD